MRWFHTQGSRMSVRQTLLPMLALSAVTLSSVGCESWNEYRYHGTVLAADGQSPVVGAKVWVNGGRSGITTGLGECAITDGTGEYRGHFFWDLSKPFTVAPPLSEVNLDVVP